MTDQESREFELLRLCLAFFKAGTGTLLFIDPEQADAVSALNEFVLAHPWVERAH